MILKWFQLFILLFAQLLVEGQTSDHPFRIRTITAGINMDGISDLESVEEAIIFLKRARQKYVDSGYEVQTLRVATQHFYEYLAGNAYTEALPALQALDRLAQKENVIVAIGHILPPDGTDSGILDWVEQLVRSTNNINFSLGIASRQLGIHEQSIRTAAQIMIRLSRIGEGGEANFRFAASAACPPGIPFFPAAYHQGPAGFALGIESPRILTEIFEKTKPEEAKFYLKKSLEEHYTPLEQIAREIAEGEAFRYNGIDVSTAPGLDASIGEAIEAHTGQPFGSASTLKTCAMITDVLKALNLKLCGFSGLMLPIIEDKVLAKRAGEEKYTVQELLLYSTVSGTGLDVVPLPGDTSPNAVIGLLGDVAALSLKYTSKPLSARLFLIPGKKAGEWVGFNNPYLTDSKVMELN